MTSARVHTASEQLRERAVVRVPGGVNSNVRLVAPPIFFANGRGAMLTDVDGNDYVDYLLGQGPNFLGHAHPTINEAVARACANGMVFGAQHPLEVDAAEAVCEALGWAEMIRFAMTGTEAVQAALRLARSATGRPRFIRFEGHYHGWLDNMLIATDGDGVTGPASSGQVAHHLDDSIILQWNDLDLLADTLAKRADEVAAVIMEPIMLNTGSIAPVPGYLQGVRDLCTSHGVILIFDEVITGFRLALGGAAEYFGVTPDLGTYGKAMAGGWPVAAVAGRADLMEKFGTGEVNQSGTFNAAVMAGAAVTATMEVLRAAPPYERVSAYGKELQVKLLELAAGHGIPLRFQGPPMALHASFGDDAPVLNPRQLAGLRLADYAAFTRVAAEHGVWLAGRGVWYVSAAHGQAELDMTLQRMDEAFGAWIKSGNS